MPCFRKRPIVIQASRWEEGRDLPGVFVETPEEAMATIGGRGHGMQCFPQPPRHYVITIHGQRAYLDPGDWVITEPDGVHHYPCKPDIFAATYEPVAPMVIVDKVAAGSRSGRGPCEPEVEEGEYD
jgi:hypothetical protein